MIGGKMSTKQRGVEEWWAGLSKGERRLIRSVMEVLRGAKRSQIAEVARAARDWERVIGFFIKFRLKAECQRQRRRGGQGSSKFQGPSSKSGQGGAEKDRRNGSAEPTSTAPGGTQR